jgi:tetratricopeptide (TPR) repeat protein
MTVSNIDPQLQESVRSWQAGLAMIQRLESARFESASMVDRDVWNLSATPADYRAAFVEYGIDPFAGDRSRALAALRSSPVKARLIAAIDDWAEMSEPRERSTLFQLARDADNDAWRNRLRAAIDADDLEQVIALVADDPQLGRSPTTIATVVSYLLKRDHAKLAIDVLRDMRQKHPTDFWINYTLGSQRLGDPSELLKSMIVAWALRPHNGTVRNALGNAYYRNRMYDRAEDEYREAIRLNPKRARHHMNLASVLMKRKKVEDAELVCRAALSIHPSNLKLHYWLAESLDRRGQEKQRNDALRRQVELFDEGGVPKFEADFDLAYTLNELAWSLATSTDKSVRNGKEAVERARRACEHTDFEVVYHIDTLAAGYAELGDFDSAIHWANRALIDAPTNPRVLEHLEIFKRRRPLWEAR